MRRVSTKCLTCEKPTRPERGHFCSFRCGWAHSEAEFGAGEGLSTCPYCGTQHTDDPFECPSCGRVMRAMRGYG